MTDEHSTEDLLRQVPMFSSLDAKALRQLARVCIRKSYRAGETIIREGQAGLGMFIIVSGQVEVYKGEGDARQLLTTRPAGGILGEMSLIDNQPRWASVVSLTDTACLLISRDRFHALVRDNAGIAWCIVPVLTERFRTVEARLLEQLEAQAKTDEPQPAAETVSAQQDEQPQTHRKQAGSEDLLDLLRIEQALLLSGAQGLQQGAAILSRFVSELGRDTRLADSERLEPVLDALPEALKQAAGRALADGERLPERMLARFRRELSRQ